MKYAGRRVLTGTMALLLTCSLAAVPTQATGSLDAFGRSYERIPGGTYYAEKTQDHVYTCRISTYPCTSAADGKHDLKFSDIKPTCTQEGFQGYVCQLCMETEIMEAPDALGHDYHGEITLPPTQEQEGEETFTCSRCDDTYVTPLPRLKPQQAPEQPSNSSEEDFGHAEEETQAEVPSHSHVWETHETPASCVQEGERVQVCVQCSAREVLETIPALGHDYQEEVTLPPTQDQEGEMTFTCSRCHDTYTEPIPKQPPAAEQSPDSDKEDQALTGNEPSGDCIDSFGRSYARVVGGTYYAEQTAKNILTGRIQSYNCPENPGRKHHLTYHKENPTCEEGDSNYYVCTLCGEKEIQLDFPALGHEYTDRITRPATPTQAGERTFTCTRCGDTYTQSIPKLDAVQEHPVERDPSAQAAKTDNLGDSAYYAYHANTVKSYLYARSDGGFTRVEALDDSVAVEVYDQDFRLMTADTVPMELPLFGGFYAGVSYNFLVFGQSNPSEQDSTEVIRVVKYDKDWNRLGQASLRGCNTSIPFDAGSLRCTEYNGMLYVQTCHEMYTSSDGLNHQANLTFSLRQSDMTVTDSQFQVSNISAGYVSHSFNQFILVDEQGRIVTLNHGDAIPRGAMLIRYDLPAGKDTFVNWQVKNEKVMSFTASSVNYNYTGASLGGLADSGSNYLTVMSTVPQTGYVEDHCVRNVVVTVTEKERFSGTQTHQITDYAKDGSQSAGTPFLIKLSDRRFLVVWDILKVGAYGAVQPGTQIGYAVIDGDGRLIGSVKTAEGSLSDCQPILDGSRVVWYTTHNSAPVFFALDVDSGTLSQSGTLSGTQPGSQTGSQSGSQSGTQSGSQSGTQSGSQSGPQSGSSHFWDVTPSFWGAPYIEKVSQAGLMTGTGRNTFDPDGQLTLAQVMVLAYQIHSQEHGGALPQTAGLWYVPYYQYCVDNGLLPEGKFELDQLDNVATRFQMLEILDQAIPASRMVPERDVPDGTIPDLNEQDLYGALVYKWYRAGLVTGDTTGSFNGSSGITRAETAVILCQINGLI